MTLPLTYKAGNCYLNASINKAHHYKDLGLKLVIGSLGINGWFEFGGRRWAKADFAKSINGYVSDSHCWLEDAEGNVYDFIFPSYDYWVRIRTDMPMRMTGLIEGVSKKTLARSGIEYVPAPMDAQALLASTTGAYIRDSISKLLSGSAVWFGDYILINPIAPITTMIRKAICPRR